MDSDKFVDSADRPVTSTETTPADTRHETIAAVVTGAHAARADAYWRTTADCQQRWWSTQMELRRRVQEARQEALGKCVAAHARLLGSRWNATTGWADSQKAYAEYQDAVRQLCGNRELQDKLSGIMAEVTETQRTVAEEARAACRKADAAYVEQLKAAWSMVDPHTVEPGTIALLRNAGSQVAPADVRPAGAPETGPQL